MQPLSRCFHHRRGAATVAAVFFGQSAFIELTITWGVIRSAHANKKSLRCYRQVAIIVVVALPSASSSRRLLRCDRCRDYPVVVWSCLGSRSCLFVFAPPLSWSTSPLLLPLDTTYRGPSIVVEFLPVWCGRATPRTGIASIVVEVLAAA